MKELIKKYLFRNKEKLTSKKAKIFYGFLLFAFVISLFIGINYVGVIIIVALLLFLMNQADGEKEKIISPWQHQEQKDEVAQLEKKAHIIRQHVENHDEDLEAKLQLQELEEQIALLKNRYGFN